MSLRTRSFRSALVSGCLIMGMIAAGFVGVTRLGWAQEQTAPTKEQPTADKPPKTAESEIKPVPKPPVKTPAAARRRSKAEPARVSLEKAREQAALMHELYEATLETVHQRYFHGDRATVPARAMQDIFETMNRRHGYEGKWISVSFPPMSIDHEPETSFEKEAALRILKDEPFHETVEDGFYRRAGSISLNGGCVTCHQGSLKPPGPGNKYAGLILSIPVLPEHDGP